MDPSLRYVHEEHKGEYGHIADFVIKYCQKQMKEYYKLQEVFIKAKPEDEATECNIFMSKEFKEPNKQENSKKIAVVLIQGTGAVRAGIWARSVCINENIELGSMLPQLDWAINFNISMQWQGVSNTLHQKEQFDPRLNIAPAGKQSDALAF